MAQAQIGRLADPERLRPWLYALARKECLRRGVPQPDVTAIDPGDRPDADMRVMAWNAVLTLAPDQREALELVTRHGLSIPDVAAVMGQSSREAEQQVTDAREVLQGAITAEILSRKGPFDCAGRSRILAGFGGTIGPELRDQVIRHVAECQACSAHRAGHVSASKVYALLPEAELPPTLRIRVMSCFTDPELVPYRRFVVRRAGGLAADGFPRETEQTPRTWPRAVVGAVTVAAALLLMVLGFRAVGLPSPGVIEGGAMVPQAGIPGWRLPSPQPNLAPVHRWPGIHPIGTSTPQPGTVVQQHGEPTRVDPSGGREGPQQPIDSPPPAHEEPSDHPSYPEDGISPDPPPDPPENPDPTPSDPPHDPDPSPTEDPDPSPSPTGGDPSQSPTPSDPPSEDPPPDDGGGDHDGGGDDDGGGHDGGGGNDGGKDKGRDQGGGGGHDGR